MIVKYVVVIILFSAPFSLISQITMTGPSQIKSNWPISANYCLNGHSSGSSYTWTTSSGIFTATQFGGTGPSSTYTNTNTCNLIETYYWTNYSPGSITVSAAGASKTTTVIPEDYSMNIQSLSIEQRTHCPSDSIIVAQVSKSYNLQPSGLLRCGPSGDCALLGHKWYLKRPNTAWIAIATVPSIPNISYTSIPSNQVNQFMLSQAGTNQPIYDSTHWSSGLISLDLSHIDYLPSGSEIYLEVQRFQGSVINSDTTMITVVPDIVLPQITSNGLGWVITGSTTGFSVPVDTNYTYQWGIQGGSIQFGQGTDSIAVLWGIPDSNVAVWVVISNGVCQDSVYLNLVISGLGTGEGIGSKAMAYPNPNAGVFTLEWSNIDAQQVLIYNGVGQVVASQPIAQGSTSTVIDLSAKAAGIYRAVIYGIEGTVTLPVYVRH